MHRRWSPDVFKLARVSRTKIQAVSNKRGTRIPIGERASRWSGVETVKASRPCPCVFPSWRARVCCRSNNFCRRTTAFRDKTTSVSLPPDIDVQELQRNKRQMPSRPSLRCVVGNKLIKAGVFGLGFFFVALQFIITWSVHFVEAETQHTHTRTAGRLQC